MSFCKNTIIFPYFTISRVFRNKKSIHYAFVGLEMYKDKKLTSLFKNISNGVIPNNNDIDILQNIFGNYNTELWISSINLKESIFFINDRIWTDDTIFQIKIKIFSYLSNIEKEFILPFHQEIWVNIKNEKNILGFVYEKETKLNSAEIIRFKPSIDSLPKIDILFVTDDDEKKSSYHIINEENMLLNDFFNNIDYKNELNNNPHIFLYLLDDEMLWIKNNPIIENNINTNLKRIWNGYVSKHWPLAYEIKSTYDENLKFYTSIKNNINITNDIISSVRETKLLDKNNIKFNNCSVTKMIIWTRPPRIENATPYRLNMIYNYLRTLISNELPFIYYVQYGDKNPNVSIYEDSILQKKLYPIEIQDWVFKKLPNGKNVLRGSGGTIQLKVYNYTTKDNIYKYSTVTIFQNSNISISLAFEDNNENNNDDIERVISRITNIFTKINDNFLIFHDHPLFNVPYLKIENNEFIFSNYTSMQFYEVTVKFQSKKNINFENLKIYMEYYKPFIDVFVFKELKNKENINLNFTYNRASDVDKLQEIFEIINKEKLTNKSKESIIEIIIKKYGKSKFQASDIYNQWKIFKMDKQTSQELLENSGLNIYIYKNENGYQIKIKGLKSLYILKNCIFFLEKVISSFFISEDRNKIQNKLKIDKNIKFDFGFEEYIPKKINNNKSDLFDYNIDSNNKIDSNYKIDSNNNSKKKIDFSSTENVDMRDESTLDPKIRLKCPKSEDVLIDKGVCKDICDFKNFKLNRLQHFEPKVYSYRAKHHSDKYSRLCSEERRPIIVSYDPDKNPKIDKKSYTYSIKYKSANDKKEYSYICPQAWCPICEIPIPLGTLKDVTYDKKKKCQYGICPNGDHKVFINKKGINEIYPGILQPTGHPDGLCMACCFKKTQLNRPTYKRCISSVNDNNSISNKNDNNIKRYISRKEKIPLEEGRFGLIPLELEVHLNQVNKCLSGNIKNGFDCFIRKGIAISDKSNIEPFLNTFLDLISGIYDKPITKKEFIDKIITSLDEKLFSSLSSGLLKRIFKTLENYNTFLLDSESDIKNIYIWDIISRPGVFVPEGINIIIFTPHSIYCPLGQDVNDIYSLSRKTFIVYNFWKIYEPIYKLKYTDNDNFEITYLHDSNNPIISKIINNAMKGCNSYDEIDWNKAGKINNIEELNLKQTIDKIDKKYKITLQVTDFYSKVTAIILDNNLYIPVKPSTLDINYPYLTTYTDFDIPILSFDKTLKYLNDVYININLPIKPIYLVEFNSMIIGILLETKRIIPIIPIKLSKVKTKLKVIDMFYYPDVNSKNYDKSYTEKRIKNINEYNYKNQIFLRFKYEISRFFQTNEGKKYKDSVIKIIEKSDDSNKYIELKKIINNLTSILVDLSNESNKKIKKVTESDKYKNPLLKKVCYDLNQKECNIDPYCIFVNKKCKLVNLLKKNLTDKLIDLLLRYPVQRKDIINGKVPIIDLKTSLDNPLDGEILLTGNKLDQKFNKLLFNNKKSFYLHILKDINLLQPTFNGVDKKEYLRIKKGNEKNIKTYSIVEITQHWVSLMNPNFRLISAITPCNSLYYIFSEISKKIIKNNSNKNYKKRNNVDIENITFINIPDIYANYILNIKSDEIQTIAKNIIPGITDVSKIIDMSDLYNLYNEKNKILSVDELYDRIKTGYPSYKPNKFDVIMLSYMLNINIVLLRLSISELIGVNIVDNNLYVVIYYNPFDKEDCIRFYALQKDAVLYTTPLNKLLKRLLNN